MKFTQMASSNTCLEGATTIFNIAKGSRSEIGSRQVVAANGAINRSNEMPNSEPTFRGGYKWVNHNVTDYFTQYHWIFMVNSIVQSIFMLKPNAEDSIILVLGMKPGPIGLS